MAVREAHAAALVFYPHYAAPFTAVLLILPVQSLRYLRVWASRNLPCGKAAGRFAILALCGSLIGVGLAAEAVRVYRGRTPDRIQAVNARKGGVERYLLKNHPGRHVIFVRCTGTHSPHEEWIYNLAGIDAQRVIRAQDMGGENASRSINSAMRDAKETRLKSRMYRLSCIQCR